MTRFTTGTTVISVQSIALTTNAYTSVMEALATKNGFASNQRNKCFQREKCSSNTHCRCILLYVDPFLQNKLRPIRHAINIKGTLKEGLRDKIVVTSVSIGLPINDTVATGLIQRVESLRKKLLSLRMRTGGLCTYIRVSRTLESKVSKPHTIDLHTLCGENNNKYSDAGLQIPVIP